MNEPKLNPSPSFPSVASAGEEPSLGDDPTDRLPINGPAVLVEAMLRHPRRVIFQLRHGEGARLILPLLAVALVFVAVYGVIVGSFSGGVQWWAAPAKIAAGMVATAAICLPSLYIFACLCGSPARLDEVVGAFGGLLALMTLLLIGFAPVAWLFSQSTESVALMGSFHLLFWMVAVRFGVRFLRTALRHSGLRSEAGLNAWVVIFLLVSVQMTVALRPLVGTADTLLPKEKRFFIAHWIKCMETRR